MAVVEPKWNVDSRLIQSIVKLERLRYPINQPGIHPQVFLELKTAFHTLESLGSARIEGNNTTVAEYADFVSSHELPSDEALRESIREIYNVEQALEYIDSNIHKGSRITTEHIHQFHKRAVGGLTREGDRTPGMFRLSNVRIRTSSHTPPNYSNIRSLMGRFEEFINHDDDVAQNHLLRMAIAHHAFTWIHPYNNGNGRTVRLMTYAMLRKQGFIVNFGEQSDNEGRILNPTAIFCTDRNKYCAKLAAADTNTAQGILDWCEYVITGLEHEIEKFDRLRNPSYLINSILLPALEYSHQRGHINQNEYRVLRQAANLNGEFVAGDLVNVIKVTPQRRSAIIAEMKERRLIQDQRGSSRKYVLKFIGPLFRGLVEALKAEGFDSASLDG